MTDRPRSNRQWVLADRPVGRGVREADFPRAEAAMAKWIAEGKLVAAEDILEGLEMMPRALIRLYTGENRGKQLVRVDPDAERYRAMDRARLLAALS